MKQLSLRLTISGCLLLGFIWVIYIFTNLINEETFPVLLILSLLWALVIIVVGIEKKERRLD